jgi:hypothetical protein
MGGEEAIGAAGVDPRISAVVAEGATGRTVADNDDIRPDDAASTLERTVEWFTYGLTDLLTVAALLSGNKTAIGEFGLTRIAMALVGLFEGMTPEAFTDQVRDFLTRSMHPTLGLPVSATTYRPMLELIHALRRRGFTIGLVTGGGTEFVRAISQALYGVPPEAVVGTMVTYAYSAEPADTDGIPRPVLRRTTGLTGEANEGAAKVSSIQAQLGRRPILAAGNSGGDRQMLEWAAAGPGPTLALLIDHDDADREFRYVGSAETFAEPEPITEVATRQGWTMVSMANDWATVFGAEAQAPNAPSSGA